MNTYPAIAFAVKNRSSLRLGISALVLLAIGYLALRNSSVDLAVVAVVSGLSVYFILALVFDVLRLIYETLVPQL